jgi:hypothetical protein
MTARGLIRCVVCPALLVAVAAAACGAIRGPGRYKGVVVFDRWGGCVLCSGYVIDYVSESAKATLKDQDRERVDLDVTHILQVFRPGDGLIKSFIQVWTKPPAPHRADPLRLSVRASGGQPAAFVVEATNACDDDVTLRYDRLAVHVMKKRTAPNPPLSVSDGPSVAVVLAHFMVDDFDSGSPRLKGEGVLENTPYRWEVIGVTALPREVRLRPREVTRLNLAVTVPPGEYDLFAAYDDYTVPGRSTASNSVGFDVAANGKASPPKASSL